MNQHLDGWTKEVIARQVKEIYLLARQLSDRPFDNVGFYATLDSGQRELDALTDSVIDETIRKRDSKALVHNNLANWGGLDRLAT
jgi:hypothetical protein